MNKIFCASGKRKAATVTARIMQVEGAKGNTITVNKRDYMDYFLQKQERDEVLRPITVSGIDLAKFNIKLIAKGGGIKAQSEAAKLAISRSISQIGENELELIRETDLLRADCRKKERKKYGMKGPRAKRQFSKR